MTFLILPRSLTSHEDYRACVALQKETWGDTFAECVPPSLLMVSQKIGGVAAGAFSASGELLGFVFGLTGVKGGRLVHWSDMLAVRPEHRDTGIGKRLKLYQKEQVQALGVEVMYWTYDPLVARNAHLNLNRLGAHVEEYVPDMYREDPEGSLHRGMSLDRFVVAWPLSVTPDEQNASSPQLEGWAEAPIVNTIVEQGNQPMPVEGELPLDSAVRVEIPTDIHALKNVSLEHAVAWRTTTRRAFMFYQERGYEISAFHRDESSGRCFYLLIRR
jgi:predicted GNAT superfamily acetyltransferase